MASLKEEGNAAFKAGQYEEAIQKYSAALAGDPKNYAIYSNRSAAYLKLGKATAALKDAEACITWKGDFARGWLRKGQAHEALVQWRDAVEAYRSGLDIDPTNDQLKQAYTAADEQERRAPRASAPAPAPAPAPPRAPAPAPAPSPTTRSNDRQVRETRQEEGAQDLMEIDVGVAIKKFVRANWIKTSLWVIGVLLMLAAPSPVTVSPEMEAEYDQIMLQAQQQFGAKITVAQQELYQAQERANSKYSYFSPSPEYDELYARQQKKEHKLAKLAGEKDAMERVARSKVGLWSDYGLAAVRDKFWYMVNEGTGFAKRSTWWDAFFLVLSGRGDEGIAGFFMRLLMNFVFNFTIGMVGALVGFFWTLWGIVQSFNPDTASAIAFFCVAGLAGVSMVFTLVFGLYGTVGGTIYVAAKAANNARLEGGGAGGRPQYIRHGRGGGGFGAQHGGGGGFGGRQPYGGGRRQHWE